MYKFIKETSGLAIFSFLLVVFLWSFPFIDYSSPLLCSIPCGVIANSSGVAALSGIISLIYIKKTGLRGKFFAIIAIILGSLGFIVLVCQG
jgi:hypothetical protein